MASDYFLSKPEQIKISVTNVCNYRCVMCFNPGLKQAKGFMPDDLYYRIVEECHAEGIGNIALGATGEPFLHKRYLDFLGRAKNLGLWVSTTSNCSFLTRDIADSILRIGLDRLNISIYSANADEHRQYTGTDTYEQTVENIQYFLNLWHETNSPMKLNMWFLQLPGLNNYDEYKKMWGPLCERIGLPLPLKPAANWSGRVENLTENHHRFSFWFERIPGYIRFCRKHRIRCNHVRSYLQVLHTGEVVPCCMIPEVGEHREILFGDLHQDSIMGVWNSERYLLFKRNLHKGRLAPYRPCSVCSEVEKVSCLHLPPISKKTVQPVVEEA